MAASWRFTRIIGRKLVKTMRLGVGIVRAFSPEYVTAASKLKVKEEDLKGRRRRWCLLKLMLKSRVSWLRDVGCKGFQLFCGLWMLFIKLGPRTNLFKETASLQSSLIKER